MGFSSVANIIGIDIKKIYSNLKNFHRFYKEYRLYNKKNNREQFSSSLNDIYPILTDYKDQAGKAKGHYFHQDLWAARKIYKSKPKEHYDIGSRIDGFIGHILPYTQVIMIDIRELDSKIEGLKYEQGDATNLDWITDNSVNSLSSLHAVEHFGLGRYGDPIDPEAPFKAMSEFERILEPGGKLLFSVPIGKERVEFNAHRIFSPNTIIKEFEKLTLLNFAGVDDEGNLLKNSSPNDFSSSEFSCGLFEFTK